MVLWIVVGYCLAAVLFYVYVVATAEEDPTEKDAMSEGQMAGDNTPVLHGLVIPSGENCECNDADSERDNSVESLCR